MSIAAPATQPSGDLELKLPATIGSANELIKNSGTAGTLEFANNLTFDGTSLKVGASTSTRPISIYSAGDAQIQFQGSGTGTGNGNSDGFVVGNSGGVDATLWNYENGYIRFATNNSEVARIDSSGRVGINTTTPEVMLDIRANDPGIQLVDTGGTSTYGNIDFVGDTLILTSRGGSSSDGIIDFRRYDGTTLDTSMRIHSSGAVTHPNQPCSFYVGLSNTATSNQLDNTETLVFATAKRNEGGHYNGSNGRFTAPVAGTYFVGVNILIDNSAPLASRSCDLQRNGNGYATLCYHRSGGESRYEGMAGTGIIELAVNDYISIRGTAGIHTGVETSFIVYLLG